MTEQLTGVDGSTATVQEGVVEGVPIIRVRTRDALTAEHAISIAAAILTARGNGDAELHAVGWHRGAWEVWYRRTPNWDLTTPTA